MAVMGVAITRGFYPLHPTLPPYMVPCEKWECDTGGGMGRVGAKEWLSGDLDSGSILAPLEPFHFWTSVSSSVKWE